MDCIFCKILAGEIPSQKVYEDEHVYAFRDINPMAPVHILVIPRKHIATVSEMESDDSPLMGRLFDAARKIAEAEGIANSGYRLVVNNGADAHQTVFHVHMHVFGGKSMGWPPWKASK